MPSKVFHALRQGYPLYSISPAQGTNTEEVDRVICCYSSTARTVSAIEEDTDIRRSRSCACHHPTASLKAYRVL